MEIEKGCWVEVAGSMGLSISAIFLSSLLLTSELEILISGMIILDQLIVSS